MEDWHLVLGIRENWGQEIPFVLSSRDRRHHLYVVGKSGTGKTTFLRNLILQDIVLGNGVGVIDPHGDLVWTPPGQMSFWSGATHRGR